MNRGNLCVNLDAYIRLYIVFGRAVISVYSVFFANCSSLRVANSAHRFPLVQRFLRGLLHLHSFSIVARVKRDGHHGGRQPSAGR